MYIYTYKYIYICVDIESERDKERERERERDFVRDQCSIPEWSHKGTQNNQNGVKRGAKTSQGTYKDTLTEQDLKIY